MNLKDQLDALLDATAFDSSGTKIGAVRQVFVDDATGKITFATVATGIFSADAIVPLHGARLLDGELHVDHTRSAVRDAPRPGHTEDGLTPDQEVSLLEHYGIDAPPRTHESASATTKRSPQPPTAPAAPRDSAKPTAAATGSTTTDEGADEGANQQPSASSSSPRAEKSGPSSATTPKDKAESSTTTPKDKAEPEEEQGTEKTPADPS